MACKPTGETFVFAQAKEGSKGPQGGMFIREYFAAQALTGMLARAPIMHWTKEDKLELAKRAYEWADAMLAAS